MHTGKGQILKLILEDGHRYVHILCPPNLVPAPGQYLLAGDGSDAPLPVPLFYTDSALQGFIAMAPISEVWSPGLELHLRGPLGRGFILPLSARKVGLIAFEDSTAPLRGLIKLALKQGAAVVLVCASTPENLPDDVEVQPMSASGDVVGWADYLAFHIARENLKQMREQLKNADRLAAGKEIQILVHTPVPCGGVAECGVCAVTLKSGWKLACTEGPVFHWSELE
jgi:NAD(P)H-flavin reductase